jgi:molybdopterin-guanine dinucleotide biosynthesis protein
MAIVVVGGHTRNIGKTGVVAGLIRALPERRWTAIKITQFGHGLCSANGEPCGCETAEHTIAISEERDPASGTDTSRYLEAGAARSLWVRTRQGQLHEAIPRLRQILAEAEARCEDALVESNSVLRFLQPDLSLSVLDPGVEDFKPSARRYLDRVDAVILPEGRALGAGWAGVSRQLVESKRCFRVSPPLYCTPELAAFVAERLQPAAASV